MTTYKPDMRFAVDWDNDLFICYDAQPTDAMNIMHTGLSSNAGLVNLHWNYINKSVVNSATSVAFAQEWTDYGIRRMRCVTGTTTNAGAYFGRTGSTNDFTVTNAATYTVSFWFKADTAGVGFTFLMENSTGSQTFTSSTSWQRIDRTITTSGTTTSFKITKTNSATDVTFDVTGFMIVSGAAVPAGFNVGDASNRYDVLRDVVMAASWSMGKRNWTDSLFGEGTLSMRLRNDSQVYSPRNTLSPLYGKFLERLKTTVDAKDPYATTWTRFWAGWTDKYDPAHKRTVEELNTTIQCTQGRNQLDRVRYTSTVTGTLTADAIIEPLLKKGFVSAATPYQTILDFSQLSACYLVGSSLMMSLDTGLSDLSVTGEGWRNDTKATQVLTDIEAVERGFTFIDRSGLFKFHNRHHYFGASPTATTIDLDTDVHEYTDVHGESHFNTIQVTYYPTTTDTGTIWESQEPIELKSGEKVKEMDVRFEFEEGTKMTVTEIAAFGSGGSDSGFSALAGAVDVTTQVDVVAILENGRGKLTLRNPTRKNVLFTVTLRGTRVKSQGGRTVDVTGDARGGRMAMGVNTKLITEDIKAKNLGNHLLNIHGENFGQIKQITIKSKNYDWFADMANTGIGAKLTLTESLYGTSDNYYICGEDNEWIPGEGLTCRFNLYPIFRVNFWRIGTSVLGVDTYLAY